MAFDRGKGKKRLFHGEWICADCGGKITELPFEPDGTRPVYCQDCWRKRRKKRR